MIGRTKFAGIVSDNAGNTKLCRRLVCDEVKTLINLLDPVHHTNSPIRDICKLDYFAEVSLS